MSGEDDVDDERLYPSGKGGVDLLGDAKKMIDRLQEEYDKVKLELGRRKRDIERMTEHYNRTVDMARKYQEERDESKAERDALMQIIRRFLLHRGECWEMLPDGMCKEVMRMRGRIGIPEAPGLADTLHALNNPDDKGGNDGEVIQGSSARDGNADPPSTSVASDPEKSVNAPWTDDQVESLNQYQLAGWLHPFTNHWRVALSNPKVDLIATTDGWVETPGGEVVQNWAHRYMADWSWKGMKPSLGDDER